MVLAFFADHLLQTEYLPSSGPWYDGAVWGNLFVVPIAVVLGAMVSTVLWPPLRRRIHRFADRKLASLKAHAEHQSMLVEEMHHLAHTGEPHPRALERMRETGSHTPDGPPGA